MAQHMARSRRTAVILLPARLTTSTMVGGRRERWEDRGLGYGDRESVRRGGAALEERGVRPEFVEPEATARSARDAAAALGCRVEQIVKSLVFRGADTGSPVLVLASGPNRVDEGRISAALGERIGKANAAFVREKAGFAIGGVPPLGPSRTAKRAGGV